MFRCQSELFDGSSEPVGPNPAQQCCIRTGIFHDASELGTEMVDEVACVVFHGDTKPRLTGEVDPQLSCSSKYRHLRLDLDRPHRHVDPMGKRKWLARLAEPEFDWKLLQTFLVVIETGSFRHAAIGGHAALNTVRGRVAELERITGRQLLHRSQGGVIATADGEAVLIVAGAMSGARIAVATALSKDQEITLAQN
jgi:molybdenum-dependent DNA-binding transcriptional regulator ModE